MSDLSTMDSKKVIAALRRHPRVAFQNLVASEEVLARLEASLPDLVAFGGAVYEGVLPVVDWDHRLPSRVVTLRLYAYYSAATLRAGEAELQTRTQQIQAQDRYPEFDVPDFSGLTADEAYEAEIDETGEAQKIRLVSAWRREIDPQVGHAAVQVVRNSDQFHSLAEETREQRPDYLGELEAVSWTPPSESNLGVWTIDVWYLMYLDASVGKGRSFLVDLDRRQVVGVREFVVRSN